MMPINPETTDNRAPIGVFDSGIGGLSILKALRLELPHERFVYFADSAHNPYGSRSDAFIVERSFAIVEQLVSGHGIKALVVACNTATAAAIGLIRAQYPHLPIVGIEPALKPAALVSRTRRIAVLATRGTLQSTKFASLLESLRTQAEFICVPCEGLADQIEAATHHDNAIDLVAACALFIRASGQFGSGNGKIDTLVLGCTHYPLIADSFHLVLQRVAQGTVQIVDNGHAVALRTRQLLTSELAKPVENSGAAQSMPLVTLLSSGSSEALKKAYKRYVCA